jgi:hypothetical protein
MWIRLTRKLADYLDGIDLTDYREGDLVFLRPRETELLIAEGWAQPLRRRSDEIRALSTPLYRAVAADSATLRTVEQLHRARQRLDQERIEDDERRRAEDLIREDLHDSHARTIAPEQT